MANRQVEPVLEVAAGTQFRPRGRVGRRIALNEENWLIPAPASNPGMVDMFTRPIDISAPNGPFAGLGEDWRNPGPWPWAGEFVGKWLTSAVQSIRMTGNARLAQVVNQVTADLLRTQDPVDGSLGIEELAWDVWNQYHVLLGLLSRFQQTGTIALLNAVTRDADRMVARYSGRAANLASDKPGDDQMNQAIIHLLLLLFQDTGTVAYLRLAEQIRDEWASGRCLNIEPDKSLKSVQCGNFLENARLGRDFFRGSRNRWESLHDVQAIAEFYLITGELRYRTAFEQIWNNLKDLERHADGGFGGAEGTTGDPQSTTYVETCATVAWMALCIDMLRLTGCPAAADELELSLFNAALGAQSPDGRQWTYHTPVAGAPLPPLPAGQVPPDPYLPEVFLGYRLPTGQDLDWQQRDRYPQLSCCAANGPRGLGCLSEWAVMRSADGVTINFYGASTTTVPAPGGGWVTIVQDTDYPLGGHIDIRLDLRVPSTFVLRLRIPAWSRSNAVRVNGVSQHCTPGRYCAIKRTWLPGDHVEVDLDLAVRFVEGAGRTAGLTLVYRGPLLLTCDGRYGTDPLAPPALYPEQPQSVSLADGDTEVRAVFRSTGRPVTLCDYASAWAFGSGRITGRPNPFVPWQFTRSGWQVDRGRAGDLLAGRTMLNPDGTIGGYSHPNESRWGFEGDTLVFYAADGRPSTRFTIREQRNRRQWLSGFSLFDPAVRHVLSEVDEGVLGKTWQFVRRSAGTDVVLLPQLTTLPGGRFDRRTHPNETSWAIDRGRLVFVTADGTVSTRFGAPQMVNGRAEYSGLFTFDASITHVLTEIDPDVTAKVWRLWQVVDPEKPKGLSDKLRLLPGGAIDGHRHPNEVRWSTDGDDILLWREDGVITTRLNPAACVNGVMRYEGRFAFDAAITHRLEERAVGWPVGPGYVSWLPIARIGSAS